VAGLDSLGLPRGAIYSPNARMRSKSAAAAICAALALLPALAFAQAAPAVGAEVKDPKGAAVGRVEKIILGQDGRPRQVLVRVDRVLRALPIEALQPSGGAYVAVLTRAEIAALPAAE
jgi:hypothetical protein